MASAFFAPMGSATDHNAVLSTSFLKMHPVFHPTNAQLLQTFHKLATIHYNLH